MGFDAVALSGQELIAGDTFISEITERGVPLVSANITADEISATIPTHISKKIGKLTVAITALTDKPKQQTSFTVQDYQDVLPVLLEKLAEEYDIIILLSNLNKATNALIAQSFPDIDLLISSDPRVGKMSPVAINGTLMTQTSSRGKYLGMLQIEWNNSSAWTNDRLPPVSQLKKRRTDLLEKIDLLVQEDSSKVKKQMARLQQQLKRLDTDIAFRMSQENALTGPANKHKLRFIPVRPTRTPDTIEAIVQQIEDLKIK